MFVLIRLLFFLNPPVFSTRSIRIDREGAGRSSSSQAKVISPDNVTIYDTPVSVNGILYEASAHAQGVITQLFVSRSTCTYGLKH